MCITRPTGDHESNLIPVLKLYSGIDKTHLSQGM